MSRGVIPRASANSRTVAPSVRRMDLTFSAESPLPTWSRMRSSIERGRGWSRSRSANLPPLSSNFPVFLPPERPGRRRLSVGGTYVIWGGGFAGRSAKFRPAAAIGGGGFPVLRDPFGAEFAGLGRTFGNHPLAGLDALFKCVTGKGKLLDLRSAGEILSGRWVFQLRQPARCSQALRKRRASGSICSGSSRTTASSSTSGSATSAGSSATTTFFWTSSFFLKVPVSGSAGLGSSASTTAGGPPRAPRPLPAAALRPRPPRHAESLLLPRHALPS